MILICGLPSESPVRQVSAALDELGARHILFNQRRFASTRLDVEIRAGVVSGTLAIDDQAYRLEDFSGAYNRLLDDQVLPEVRGLPPDDPARLRCRRLHDALAQWSEIAPARVVNRIGPMGSNSSKPYQMQLIRACGFAVPPTLITNDPQQVEAFQRRYGQVIFKSVSAVRSIVALLRPEDYGRLERIRWCPTQFQAFVEGANVRVHVVGRQLFATRISTDAVDYRYAVRQGSRTELQAVELDEGLAEKCFALASALGLPFAGVDLKVTPEGQVYCFEVNPSPGFTYYEAHTGQPIAAAVARYLAGD